MTMYCSLTWLHCRLPRKLAYNYCSFILCVIVACFRQVLNAGHRANTCTINGWCLCLKSSSICNRTVTCNQTQARVYKINKIYQQPMSLTVQCTFIPNTISKFRNKICDHFRCSVILQQGHAVTAFSGMLPSTDLCVSIPLNLS